MSDLKIVLPTGRGKKRKEELISFVNAVEALVERVGFKISARGWGYTLEGFGLINKSQIDKVENLINYCRKTKLLPIDFTAEEEARGFSGVEVPTNEPPTEWLKGYLHAALTCEDWYIPDWWKNEEYYVQMIVEKIDLKNLFGPICKEYHIPIATSKGWSSILQRAKYARRFKWAEEDGLKCVLLYCGDYDPDGLRISEFLRKNLWDVANIRWLRGGGGYCPADLTIDRFGLNLDFITKYNLTWIDNLMTSRGRNLASPSHPNFKMDYIQNYLRTVGERKCEANALLINKEAGRELCRDAIEKYLGFGALKRFAEKRKAIQEQLKEFRERTNLNETINEAIRIIDEEEDKEED